MPAVVTATISTHAVLQPYTYTCHDNINASVFRELELEAMTQQTADELPKLH
jgi:hypothetical protein